MLAIEFIKRIISLFRAYVNNVSEMKIRSNFSLIYQVRVSGYVDVQLLDEVADFGVPVITEPSIMSSLIAVPTTLNKMSTFMNKVVVCMVFSAHIGFCRRGYVASRIQQLDDQLASSGREVRA